MRGQLKKSPITYSFFIISHVIDLQFSLVEKDVHSKLGDWHPGLTGSPSRKIGSCVLTQVRTSFHNNLLIESRGLHARCWTENRKERDGDNCEALSPL